jgi:hypothetical protein
MRFEIRDIVKLETSLETLQVDRRSVPIVRTYQRSSSRRQQAERIELLQQPVCFSSVASSASKSEVLSRVAPAFGDR